VPKRILIVEDEIGTGLALKMQAQRCAPGAAVDRYSGRSSEFEDWLTLQEGPPDVAIVDLQLIHRNGIDPDGGFEVLEHLRARGVATAVIIMTARSDRQAVDRARDFKSGKGPAPVVKHYFTKPWNKGDLKSAIEDCLNDRQKIGDIEFHGVLE
jgi:CheY-like chemotaxis protein